MPSRQTPFLRKPPSHGPWPLRLAPLLLSFSLGAQAQLPGLLGDLVDKLKQQAAATTTNDDPAQASAAAAAAAAAAQSAPLLNASRDDAGMQRLFEKNTVSGADLLPELKGVRKVAGGRGVADISVLLSGNVVNSGTDAGGGLLGGLLQGGVEGIAMKAAMIPFEAALAQMTLNVASVELRRHLDMLIGDSTALESEQVTLPSARGLTRPQMQRAVNLAAIVVATRLTGRLLKQAQQDLAGLEDEYKALIARREVAATLLLQALSSGLPANAGKLYTPAQLAYLRQMSTETFAKDLAAQELALKLVALTDKQSYQDYRAQSQAMGKRYTAAMRTMAGVTAFGGLLTWSGRELAKLGREQPIAELLAFGPLAVDFIAEVPPILKSIMEIAADGGTLLLTSAKAFRIEVDGKTEEVSSASAVFDALATHGAIPRLREAMFRDSSRGLLYAVHQCDPVVTGQMLDEATDATVRSEFALEFKPSLGDGFSFTDALAPGEGARKNLASELLSSDYRPRLARNPALAKVQYSVAGRDDEPNGGKAGFLSWNKAQLLRLLFASSAAENKPQYAMLEIDKVRVYPVPSMDSLAAFDALADACRRGLAPSAQGVATVASPPANKPVPQQSSPQKKT